MLEFTTIILCSLGLKVFQRITSMNVVVSKNNGCIVESWQCRLPLLRFERFSAWVM
jgi:hypothetical protein